MGGWLRSFLLPLRCDPPLVTAAVEDREVGGVGALAVVQTRRTSFRASAHCLLELQCRLLLLRLLLRALQRSKGIKKESNARFLIFGWDNDRFHLPIQVGRRLTGKDRKVKLKPNVSIPDKSIRNSCKRCWIK